MTVYPPQLSYACVPELGASAAIDPSKPNGVCKADGARGCPFPLARTKRTDPILDGLVGFDDVCLPGVQQR